MATSFDFGAALSDNFQRNLISSINTLPGAVGTGYSTYINLSNLFAGSTFAGKVIQFGRNIEASLVSFSTGATSFDTSGFVNAGAGLAIAGGTCGTPPSQLVASECVL